MFAQALSRSCATGFRRWLAVSALAVALQFTLAQPSVAQAPTSEEIWNELANEIFKGRPLADGTGLVGIEMPTRAEDAAIVPVTMRVTLPLGDPRRVKALTLVIDENPAPVAATFEFGDNAGVSMISTRVRVNSYTDVHARCGVDRQQALCGQDLCEGVRRVFGSGCQERGRSAREPRARCGSGCSAIRPTAAPASRGRRRS